MEKIPALAMRLAEGICKRFVSIESEFRGLRTKSDPLAIFLNQPLPLLICNIMNGQDQFFAGIYLTYLLKALDAQIDAQNLVISSTMMPHEITGSGYIPYTQRLVRDMRYRKEKLMQTRNDEEGPVAELPAPWEKILSHLKFEV